MMVVIDGPAGSGKSSTAKAVADRLDMQYIDSGAIYRVVALLYIQSDFDENKFFEFFDEANISFHYENGIFHVYLNGEEVTVTIRSAEVTDNVSKVASMPEVRSKVTGFLRESVRKGDYISDGRDLGTVVYPDADLKIFMVADLEKRALRRWKELKDSHQPIDLDKIRKNLKSRDQIDSNRNTAPLKKAKDAVEIDTSDLSFDEQVDMIISHIKSVTNAGV
jgi:cytidylate kinase